MPLVWIVDPALQRVTVYRSLHDIRILTPEDELDGGQVVPGFRINIAEITAVRLKLEQNQLVGISD